ncbi:MAG: hypothetical protein ACREHG_08520, partial [Candidatus Saccharimonadales bacterium]
DQMDGTSYLKKVKATKFYQDQAEALKKNGASDADIEDFYKDEALARAVGDRGAKLANRTAFVQWLNDFWDRVKRMAGINKSPLEISKMTMGDFAGAIAKKLLSGEKLSGPSEGETRFQVDDDNADLEEPLFKDHNRLIKKIDYIYDKYIRSSGLGGQDIRQIRERAIGEKNKIIQWGKTIAKQYHNAIKNHPENERESISQLVSFYLESPMKEKPFLLNTLPEDIRPIAKSMHSLILRNQDWILAHGNLIEEGKVKIKNGQVQLNELGEPIMYPSPKEAFKAMRGHYLARIYKAYGDKDWTENKISPDEQRRLTKMMQDKRVAEEPELINEPEKLIELAKQDVRDIVGESKTKKSNMGLFTHRDNMSEMYRIAWGEIPDAEQRFTASFFKQANIIGGAHFANDLKERGFGKIFYRKEDKRPSDFSIKINDPRLAPLNGLYTNKQFHEAIQNYLDGYSIVSKFKIKWKAYRPAYGFLKIMKTAYNIPSHLLNFTSRGIIAFANGNMDVNNIGLSYKAVKDQLKYNDKEGSKKIMDEAIERGVINHGLSYGMLKELLDGSVLGDKYDRVKSKTKNVLSDLAFLSKIYGAEDDFWNVFNYLNEKQKYAKAIYDKNATELTDEENNAVADKVAEIVKNTQPTYSRVYPVIKLLNAFPLFGDFLSYRFENYRISYNAIEQSIKEMRDENPAIKRIGKKRMAGMMGYLGYKIALNEGAKFATPYVVNASIGGLSGLVGSSNAEKQKRKDLELFVAPYAKHYDVAFTNPSQGVYIYHMIGQQDPFGDEQAVMNAMTEPGVDMGQRVKNTMSSIFGDVLTAGIPLQLWKDLSTGKTSYGGNIWYDYDSGDMKFIKGSAYVLKEFLTPQTIISIINANKQKHIPVGKDITERMLHYTPYYMDVAKQFSYKLYDDEEPLQKLVSGHKKGKSTDVYYNDRMNHYIKELSEYYQAAMRLGADEYAMRRTIYYSRLPKEIKYKLLQQ